MTPRFAVFKSKSGSVGVDEEDEEPSVENHRNSEPPSHPIVQAIMGKPGWILGKVSKICWMKQIKETVKATGSALKVFDNSSQPTLKAVVGSFVQNIEEPDILIREYAEAGLVGSD
ncbi:hypothetical protein U1Q18_047433 [Sarracenia purpurea var. burkii]